MLKLCLHTLSPANPASGGFQPYFKGPKGWTEDFKGVDINPRPPSSLCTSTDPTKHNININGRLPVPHYRSCGRRNASISDKVSPVSRCIFLTQDLVLFSTLGVPNGSWSIPCRLHTAFHRLLQLW